MRTTRRRQILLGLALVISATAASPAVAEWPEKPITFVIPYSTGGGFDAYVRAIAPEMEKVLGVEVVPKNIPGAGGVRGAATVYRAEPDGYTIGIWNMPGLTVPQMLGNDIDYDLNKVSWIGNLATSLYGLAVKKDSSIGSVEDLCSLGRPAKISDTGPASTAAVTTRIALSSIECPYVLVYGYKGSSGATIAVMRGEVDATIKPAATLLKYAKTDDVRLILSFESSPTFEGVTASGEVGLEGFEELVQRRVVGGPPGLPDDIREKLTAALLTAANSESVKAWSESTRNTVDPVGAEEASALVADMMDYYAEYKDLLAE